MFKVNNNDNKATSAEVTLVSILLSLDTINIPLTTHRSDLAY